MTSGSELHAGQPVQVMVVDDSLVIRGLITRALESDAGIKVVASVADGSMALRTLERQDIDVIVLDIEMPVMDGITALPKLLALRPGVKIVMASTLTGPNAEISLRALALGAADYIPKPTTTRAMTDAEDFKRELVAKVKALGAPKRTQPTATTAPVAKPAPVFKAQAKGPAITPRALAIGSSTGGPQALFEVAKSLRDLSVPVFITQHMPPTFTSILAQHISKQAGVDCGEALEGEIVKPGQIYLAPGDRHLTLRQFGGDVRITLSDGPPENFCRPAVDPMLRSLSQVYGGALLVAILTGMGSDGAKGAVEVVQAGGSVIAQDEATSVVWGMPGSVVHAGVPAEVLPLPAIGPRLRQAVMKPQLETAR